MFPTTEREMRDVIRTNHAQYRIDGTLVPEGLNLTTTEISNFWRYKEGNRMACLHERDSDGHVCFGIAHA